LTLANLVVNEHLKDHSETNIQINTHVNQSSGLKRSQEDSLTTQASADLQRN
jgi:hypothetical protein